MAAGLSSRRGFVRGLLVVSGSCAGLLAESFAKAVDAGSYDDERANSGARQWFRATLAADVELAKRVSPDGALRLLVLHSGDEKRARTLALMIATANAPASAARENQSTVLAAPIKGIPARIELKRATDLTTIDSGGVGGIFVAQPVSKERLAEINRFGETRGVIVFSPFEGDLERGTMTGLFVGAQLLPAVNPRTLAGARITLSPAFRKIAKVVQ